MAARFCGRCNKLLDDIQCPHCGTQTQPMNLTPPWVEDYESDQQEADLDATYRENVDFSSNPFRECPRHFDYCKATLP